MYRLIHFAIICPIKTNFLHFTARILSPLAPCNIITSPSLYIMHLRNDGPNSPVIKQLTCVSHLMISVYGRVYAAGVTRLRSFHFTCTSLIKPRFCPCSSASERSACSCDKKESKSNRKNMSPGVIRRLRSRFIRLEGADTELLTKSVRITPLAHQGLFYWT